MNQNIKSKNSELSIYSKRCCQSFVLHVITVEEVNSCINNFVLPLGLMEFLQVYQIVKSYIGPYFITVI